MEQGPPTPPAFLQPPSPAFRSAQISLYYSIFRNSGKIGKKACAYRAGIYCEPDAILAIQTAAEDFIVETFPVRMRSCILTPSLVLLRRA